jgi:hypothetical protein
MVSNEDMAGRLERGIHRDQRQAAANEWMGRVSDNDILRWFVGRVLERGIQLRCRLTKCNRSRG